MLMSHAATSAVVAGRPRFGVSRAAGPAQPPNAMMQLATASVSRVDILDLAIRLHAPGLDRVVVIDRVRAVPRDELAARRLHDAGVVGRATLEHRGRAVPLP